MSWLARSIANSLRIDDDDEDDTHIANTHNNNGGDLNSSLKPESEAVQVQPNSQSSSSPSAPAGRGVREDLSELTKTISGKFWGVASFLAPPSDPSHPQTRISDPEPSDQSNDRPDSKPSDDEAVIAGIRSDFAEIGGKLRSGISQLSSNKTVSEISKFASNFLQFGSEEERSLEEYDLDGVVGVTEEVVAYARKIAMHPETLLDFPQSDDADSDDFELSDAQHEHALAIERVAPRLAALRMELCPGYMNDGCFWKIYFILLQPLLNKNDAELLSNPQIVDGRAALTEELDKRSKEKQELESSSSGNIHFKEQEQHLSVSSSSQLELEPPQTSAVEAAPSLVVPDEEMEKNPVQSTEIQIDNSVVDETPVNLSSKDKEAPVNAFVQSSSGSANRTSNESDEDDSEDWLKEDTSEMVGPSRASIATANDDDVSFSDLEDDDSYVPTSYKKATPGSDSSAKDSRGWVQLCRSSSDSGKDINSVSNRHAGFELASGHNSETKDSSDWLDVDDIDAM